MEGKREMPWHCGVPGRVVRVGGSPAMEGRGLLPPDLTLAPPPIAHRAGSAPPASSVRVMHSRPVPQASGRPRPSAAPFLPLSSLSAGGEQPIAVLGFVLGGSLLLLVLGYVLTKWYREGRCWHREYRLPGSVPSCRPASWGWGVGQWGQGRPVLFPPWLKEGMRRMERADPLPQD